MALEREGPWGDNTKRGEETTYDGDGRPAKRAELQKTRYGGVWYDWNYFNWYFLYSSVTGQKITDIALDGSYAGHSVYMGGTAIFDNTYQGPFQNESPYTAIGFKVTDPVSGSSQEMNPGGEIPTHASNPNARNELGGLGTSIPAVEPTASYQPNHRRGGYAGFAGTGCEINNGPVPCSTMMGYLHSQGLLFAGNHIVMETWQEKGSIRGWKDGRYFVPDRENPDKKIWWEFKGRTVIELPGGGDDDVKSPFHFFSSDSKLSDADCDSKMSKIFGGVAKAMEKAGDINGIDRYALGPGHSATPENDKPLYTWVDVNQNGKKDKRETFKDVDRGGIIHTYTDESASSRTNTALFAPGGWRSAGSYYTGGNSGLVFNYSNGITIEFVHAGTSNKNLTPSIPKNPGVGNLAGIGYVGGAGGEGGPISIWENGKLTGNSTAGYNHTHIVFFSNKANNTRIDPRTIFCGW